MTRSSDVHDGRTGSERSSPGERVVPGAYRVAVVRRLRWCGLALTGGRGVRVAALSWLFVATVAVLAGLLGGPFGLFAVAVATVVVVAARLAGLPTPTVRWAMLAAAVVALGSGGYFWWAVGASIDAADLGLPDPPGTQYAGASLILFALAVVTLAVLTVLWALRRPSR